MPSALSKVKASIEERKKKDSSTTDSGANPARPDSGESTFLTRVAKGIGNATGLRTPGASKVQTQSVAAAPVSSGSHRGDLLMDDDRMEQELAEHKAAVAASGGGATPPPSEPPPSPPSNSAPVIRRKGIGTDQERTASATALERLANYSPSAAQTKAAEKARADRKGKLLAEFKGHYDKPIEQRDRVGHKYAQEAKNTGPRNKTTDAIKETASSVIEAANSTEGKALDMVGRALIGGSAANIAKSGSVMASALATEHEQATNTERLAATESHLKDYADSKRNLHEDFDNIRAVSKIPSASHPQEPGAAPFKRSDLSVEEAAKESKLTRLRWKALMPTLARGLKASEFAKASGRGDALAKEIKTEHIAIQTSAAPGTKAKDLAVEGTYMGDITRLAKGKKRMKLSRDRKRELEGVERQQNDLKLKAEAEIAARKRGVGVHQGYDFDKEQDDYDDHETKKKQLEGDATKNLKKRTSSGWFGSGKPEFTPEEQTKHAKAQSGFNDATAGAQSRRAAEAQRHKSAMASIEKQYVNKNKVGRAADQGVSFKPGTPASIKDQYKKHAKTAQAISTPATLSDLSKYMGEGDDADAAESHWKGMKNLETLRDTGLDLKQTEDLAKHKEGMSQIEKRRKTGLSSQDRKAKEYLHARPNAIYKEQRDETMALKNAGDRRVEADGTIKMFDPTKDTVESLAKTRGEKASQAANQGFSTLKEGADIASGSSKVQMKALREGNTRKAKLTAGVSLGVEAGKIASHASGGAGHAVIAGYQATVKAGQAVGSLGKAATAQGADRADAKDDQLSVITGKRQQEDRPINWQHAGLAADAPDDVLESLGSLYSAGSQLNDVHEDVARHSAADAHEHGGARERSDDSDAAVVSPEQPTTPVVDSDKDEAPIAVTTKEPDAEAVSPEQPTTPVDKDEQEEPVAPVAPVDKDEEEEPVAPVAPVDKDEEEEHEDSDEEEVEGETNEDETPDDDANSAHKPDTDDIPAEEPAVDPDLSDKERTSITIPAEGPTDDADLADEERTSISKESDPEEENEGSLTDGLLAEKDDEDEEEEDEEEVEGKEDENDPTKKKRKKKKTKPVSTVTPSVVPTPPGPAPAPQPSVSEDKDRYKDLLGSRLGDKGKRRKFVNGRVSGFSSQNQGTSTAQRVAAGDKSWTWGWLSRAFSGKKSASSGGGAERSPDDLPAQANAKNFRQFSSLPERPKLDDSEGSTASKGSWFSRMWGSGRSSFKSR